MGADTEIGLHRLFTLTEVREGTGLHLAHHDAGMEDQGDEALTDLGPSPDQFLHMIVDELMVDSLSKTSRNLAV